jgi:hypothetical protein
MKEALKFLQAIAHSFGPDEAVHFEQETWSKIHASIKDLVKQERKRPPNCGTGYCSCIECVMEQEQGGTKRPVESDYLSYTAYTRALEAYCDEQEKADTVDGKTFDRFVALNESNAARILELEAQLAEQEQGEVQHEKK